jgi:hypothetical protein
LYFYEFVIMVCFCVPFGIFLSFLFESNPQVKVPESLFDDFFMSASQSSWDFGSGYNPENPRCSSVRSPSEKFNYFLSQQEKKDLTEVVEILATSMTGNTMTYLDLPDLSFQNTHTFLKAASPKDCTPALNLVSNIKKAFDADRISDQRPYFSYNIYDTGKVWDLCNKKDPNFLKEMSHDIVNMTKLMKAIYKDRPLNYNNHEIINYGKVALQINGYSHKESFRLYYNIAKHHHVAFGSAESLKIKFFKTYHRI